MKAKLGRWNPLKDFTEVSKLSISALSIAQLGAHLRVKRTVELFSSLRKLTKRGTTGI